MARVLVVDDSEIDRQIVAELMAGEEDLEFEGVEDGKSALERIEADPPDLVLTDLIMPVMNGFEVVASIRESFPSVPVVLMTSQGNEEIAVRALREGAASYVPKRVIADTLIPTLRDVLDLAGRERAERRLLATLQQSEFTFSLGNLEELVLPLVKYLQEMTGMMVVGDEAEVTQIGVAICEALNNAIEHGNLEVGADLRGSDIVAHGELMRKRQKEPPYCDRRVHVEAQMDREQARFVVRDEGPGFDPATLPDPRAPENLDRFHGRGVLLIRSFMDEVTWNERGNEVTMIKRWE
jgi:CheY-like chemotaxis protein/anti-sigma regulatory factor (Ser/Thr protein kinase)